MRITPLGAVGEVTGSSYLVETDGARVLIDLGLFQGSAKSEIKNRLPREVHGRKLDAVLLTHAHLDHTGRLPLLWRHDVKAPIFATPATRELAHVILLDSAGLQMSEAMRQNRKRQRAGQPLVEPLYTEGDVVATMAQFTDVGLQRDIAVAPGVTATWTEAGHLLGSASIRLTVTEKGAKRTVVFSGDIGQWGAPLLNDPDPFKAADLVLMESTYGGHDHRPLKQTREEFREIIKDAIANRRKILVPTFAVGRAQVLLLELAIMFRERIVRPFPIFLDSPMAIKAGKITTAHPELADAEVRYYREHGGPIRNELKTLKIVTSAEESKALNEVGGPCMILAGSGMCNGGRILHHLKYNLWQPTTCVLIVGFQGNGTLGRRLVNKEPKVKIFGEPVAVKAEVRTLGGFSAHAGQRDLLKWLKPMARTKPRVVLVHGEDDRRLALSSAIKEAYGINAERPEAGDVIEF